MPTDTDDWVRFVAAPPWREIDRIVRKIPVAYHPDVPAVAARAYVAILDAFRECTRVCLSLQEFPSRPDAYAVVFGRFATAVAVARAAYHQADITFRRGGPPNVAFDTLNDLFKVLNAAPPADVPPGDRDFGPLQALVDGGRLFPDRMVEGIRDQLARLPPPHRPPDGPPPPPDWFHVGWTLFQYARVMENVAFYGEVPDPGPIPAGWEAAHRAEVNGHRAMAVPALAGATTDPPGGVVRVAELRVVADRAGSLALGLVTTLARPDRWGRVADDWPSPGDRERYEDVRADARTLARAADALFAAADGLLAVPRREEAPPQVLSVPPTVPVPLTAPVPPAVSPPRTRRRGPAPVPPPHVVRALGLWAAFAAVRQGRRSTVADFVAWLREEHRLTVPAAVFTQWRDTLRKRRERGR